MLYCPLLTAVEESPELSHKGFPVEGAFGSELGESLFYLHKQVVFKLFVGAWHKAESLGDCVTFPDVLFLNNWYFKTKTSWRV